MADFMHRYVHVLICMLACACLGVFTCLRVKLSVCLCVKLSVCMCLLLRRACAQGRIYKGTASVQIIHVQTLLLEPQALPQNL